MNCNTTHYRANSSSVPGDPTDPLDADNGPNGLLNTATLTKAEGFKHSLRVTGSLDAAPLANYSISFYYAPAADPGGALALDTFAGWAIVSTDAAGHATIDAHLDLPERANDAYKVTAIVTDAVNNSGETSLAIPVTHPAFTVYTQADSGPGSLRQAIIDANAAPGLNSIRFDLPAIALGLPQEIQLLSALPALTDAVVIDGSAQDTFNPPRIIGPKNATDVDGLVLEAGNSRITDLVLTGFRHGVVVRSSNNVLGGDPILPLFIYGNSGDAVRIDSGTGNLIRGNRLDTNGGLRINLGTDGATPNDPDDADDADEGPNRLQNTPVLEKILRQLNAPSLLVGSLHSTPNTTFTIDAYQNNYNAPPEGQLFSGFDTAITTVITDATGFATFAIPVSLNSISDTLTATATDPDGNTSELSNAAALEFLPLVVTDPADSGPGSLRQALSDAAGLIGPDTIRFAIPGGGVHRITVAATPLPTFSDAVTLDGASQPGYSGSPLIELVAGTNITGLRIDATSDGSTIRGLAIGGFGVAIDSRGKNSVIAGNYIGLAADGSPLSNSSGVLDTGVATRIGGTVPGDRNVISSNSSEGLSLSGTNTLVQGNRIGTDPSGLLARPNGIGIRFSAKASIGGTAPGAGNLISGNVNEGIRYQVTTSADASYALIQGNYIGTDVTGAKALPNAIGVHMLGRGATIGGLAASGAGNVISGNSAQGVYVEARNTLVQGNLIGLAADGLSPLGNGGAGIELKGAGSSAGGASTALANVIAYNTGPGVAVTSLTSRPLTGNPIRLNSIHDNAGGGIDLGANGPTANDAGDADTGPNDLQNFPVLTDAAAASNQTLVSGALNSNPGTTFVLDFYANPPGKNQGQRYLGSATVKTDSSGNAAFRVVLPATSTPGESVTVTATAFSTQSLLPNATSEFSAPSNVVIAADANADGAVDFVDLAALAQHYNSASSSRAEGDFNRDGQANFSDLVLLAQSYNLPQNVFAAFSPAQAAPARQSQNSGAPSSGFSRKPVASRRPTPTPANVAPARQVFQIKRRLQDVLVS